MTCLSLEELVTGEYDCLTNTLHVRKHCGRWSTEKGFMVNEIGRNRRTLILVFPKTYDILLCHSSVGSTRSIMKAYKKYFPSTAQPKAEQ
jgi:hypothetical protein